MACKVVMELEEIVEHILDQLPMKYLHTTARVCKQWNAVTTRIKRSRRQICWLLHDESSADIASSIQARLQSIPSEPQFALVLCTTSLHDEAVPVPTECPSGFSRHPRAAKMERVVVSDYIKKVLPPACGLLGSATDGIVGTSLPPCKASEYENCTALSCLLLPALEGVTVQHFHITPQTLQVIGPFQPTTETSSPDPHRLSQATGIPLDVKPKLILLFQTESAMIHNQDTDIDAALLRHYGNVVIAGGYVDNIIPETCGCTAAAADSGEANGLGIAFSGENVRVASVVIDRHVRTRKDVEHALQKLKNCHVPQDNCVCFMFACIGRGEHYYNEKNLESSVFQKLFPGIPVFGFFGNGETGYDYLPDYSTPEGDSNMCLMGQYPDDESGYVWDMPSTQHSYTTICVLVSFGKTK